jgi:DNA-binding response OmpR family regulator
VSPPAGVAVLVVEDDADLRYMFRIALTIAGFSVREAADGYLGLVMLEQDPPDVIVLDLNLPRVDGFSILEEIASRDAPTPPVVVVTGLDGVQRDDAVVLRKPIDPGTLVSTVRSVLRRSVSGTES